MNRPGPASRLLLLASGFFLLAVAPGSADDPQPPPAGPRVLPGVQASGAVLLHNQWSLKPAGKQVEMGDFPVNVSIRTGGEWLAALHAGFGEHEIIVVHLPTLKVKCRVSVDQAFYGLTFSTDGKVLYASGGEYQLLHAFDFDDGLLSKHRTIPLASPEETFVPGGLAVEPTGKFLYAAGTWGDRVAVVPTDHPEKKTFVALEKGSYPYAVLPDADGKRLFVSLWNKAAVAVVDLEKQNVAATWETEAHPTEMALSPDGKALYVACANSTQVRVVDPATGNGLETITCSLYPNAPAGNTPSSLALTADGKLLFVSNSNANNVAVFNVAEPGKSRPLGFVPVGWYPTAVRYSEVDKRLYVANGRGATPKANPQGPNPGLPRTQTVRQYIAALYRGTLSVVDLPTPDRMAEYTKTAHACSPLRDDLAVTAPAPVDSPIPAKVGGASPIKHVLYIIKENRTYDQVFGDVKEGNGDPSLCLFPEKVTPNHHKLAREFVLLDNFYCDGEISASGHEWSMGAYCTDFIEKVWPLTYRKSDAKPKKLPGYPGEGEVDDIARPAGGYLWDRCAAAKVSYRSYGEWVKNAKKVGDPGRAAVKALEGHFDPLFRSFDMDYPDQKRADRFIEELAQFERDGGFPQLTILRLPNDHTAGTLPGKPTPTAYLADNDLALGRVVEAVSKSKFWKETAIFVVEDDAQNGSDHVDAHRTVALVVSPYTKRQYVDSTPYSTAGMLRTMELILGLRPMSQFDAAARPMYASFRAKADETPYRHAVPEVDLTEKNTARSWGAKLSETFDLTKEDAVDDMLLNRVIWHAVRGPAVKMPPPVHAAFVFPHLKKDDDDD